MADGNHRAILILNESVEIRYYSQHLRIPSASFFALLLTQKLNEECDLEMWQDNSRSSPEFSRDQKNSSSHFNCTSKSVAIGVDFCCKSSLIYHKSQKAQKRIDRVSWYKKCTKSVPRDSSNVVGKLLKKIVTIWHEN